jgi:CelD/BcsL family acetyltransferase involved in cellulose biosynthesis
MVELLRVRAGNEDLGYLYNFLVDGKVLFFQSGFSYTDAEDARYKPGLVTHTVAIEHYQGRGFKEYDFLAGEARYKRSLGKSLRSLCWAVIYRQTLRMSVLLWLRRRFVRADVIEKAQATAEVG